MTTREKLEIIQRILGLTQTELALRFGVSFPAYNSWWNNKSIPRPKMLVQIDELFQEVTGQKKITNDVLESKKMALHQKSLTFKSVIKKIVNNPDIRDEFILKLTYHSNSIEGSTLTEPDTAAIIFDNVSIPDKTITEQLEAKNHQSALNYLFDFVVRGDEIDEKFILKLHSILMNSIRPDAGQYRNHGVRITGVDLPTANYMSIPKLIDELVSTLQKKTKDIVSLTTIVHAKFEKIHPFSDGNGRVGRLLMNAMLLKANLPPAIIRQQLKQIYYTHLYKAQTKEEYIPLEHFVYEGIVDGFRVLERKGMVR